MDPFLMQSAQHALYVSESNYEFLRWNYFQQNFWDFTSEIYSTWWTCTDWIKLSWKGEANNQLKS